MSKTQNMYKQPKNYIRRNILNNSKAINQSIPSGFYKPHEIKPINNIFMNNNINNMNSVMNVLPSQQQTSLNNPHVYDKNYNITQFVNNDDRQFIKNIPEHQSVSLSYHSNNIILPTNNISLPQNENTLQNLVDNNHTIIPDMMWMENPDISHQNIEFSPNIQINNQFYNFENIINTSNNQCCVQENLTQNILTLPQTNYIQVNNQIYASDNNQLWNNNIQDTNINYQQIDNQRQNINYIANSNFTQDIVNNNVPLVSDMINNTTIIYTDNSNQQVINYSKENIQSTSNNTNNYVLRFIRSNEDNVFYTIDHNTFNQVLSGNIPPNIQSIISQSSSNSNISTQLIITVEPKNGLVTIVEGIDLMENSANWKKMPNNGGFYCNLCNKSYTRKYGLKIHLRIHSGFKPLECKTCNKRFGDPSNMAKHIRLHSAEGSPYKCTLCEKHLVRRRDLERHMRSRHPGIPFKSEPAKPSRKSQKRSKNF